MWAWQALGEGTVRRPWATRSSATILLRSDDPGIQTARGVEAEKRGTYLALAETGKTYVEEEGVVLTPCVPGIDCLGEEVEEVLRVALEERVAEWEADFVVNVRATDTMLGRVEVACQEHQNLLMG